MTTELRKRFYRVAFMLDDVPEGTMLIPAITVEMAISRCAEVFRGKGKKFSVHSVNPIFMSDIEEHDFLHFIINGNSIQADDIVDIEKRMKGE